MDIDDDDNDNALVHAQLSCEFKKLNEALEWAAANCAQGPPGSTVEEQDLYPMLMIAKQKPYKDPKTGAIKGRRTFVALCTTVLEKFFASFGSEAVRHLDEVIPADAPCKFALDCDWKVSKHGLAGRATEAQLFADLDADFAALVARVVNLIAERHSVRVEPCISTACMAGKWSMHAVFDGAVWKSAQHCGALARELRDADVERCGGVRERSLVYQYVDVGIYQTNHSLRMYRSSKVDEPSRAFRRAGEQADAPLDVEFLRKSIITLFQVPGVEGDQMHYVTSLFARRFGAMLQFKPLEHPNANNSERSTAVARPRALQAVNNSKGGSGSNAWTRAFVEAFRSQGAYQAEPELEQGRMRLRCLNHQCEIRGGAHTKENIFLQIDLIECVWRQNCFNPVCRKTPTKWRPLTEELALLCESVYEQWSGAQLAGELGVYAERLANLQ